MSSAAKTEVGNERCLQPWLILSKQDGENAWSLPAEAPGSLSYRTTCSAELCPALLRGAGGGSWPRSWRRWLVPHTEQGWKAPSAEVPVPLAPRSALLLGSRIALQMPSKTPTFPLSKQIGLSGISRLGVWLCAFMGTCGFPQAEAPSLCFPFSGGTSY